MKPLVVLAVCIVMVSFLFCPLAIAADPLPNDVKMVKPDPSLPKELTDFWGKWEGGDPARRFFIIVEKIDGAKASLYMWRSAVSFRGGVISGGWVRLKAKVSKESGKYKLSYPNDVGGITTFALVGEILVGNTPAGEARLSRVP